MFDDLIGNTDPNLGNWLVDPAWNLILIDHTRAFTTTKELYHQLTQIDSELWERMKALDEAKLKAAVGSLARRPVDSRHPGPARQDANCLRQAEEVVMTDVTAHDARVADILSRFDETSSRFLARLERAGDRGRRRPAAGQPAQIGAHVAMVNDSLASVIDGSGPGDGRRPTTSSSAPGRTWSSTLPERNESPARFVPPAATTLGGAVERSEVEHGQAARCAVRPDARTLPLLLHPSALRDHVAVSGG